MLERTHEAGRITGRKQLLGVGGGAGAAHRLGWRQLDVEQAVVAARAAFAAAGGLGACGVNHLVESGCHGGFLGLNASVKRVAKKLLNR